MWKIEMLPSLRGILLALSRSKKEKNTRKNKFRDKDENIRLKKN
jgi:hypothetical protein